MWIGVACKEDIYIYIYIYIYMNKVWMLYHDDNWASYKINAEVSSV